MRKTMLMLMLIIIAICSTVSAQFVAKMQVKEDIEGICDKNEVYALFPMIDKNQVEAVCPVSKSEILKRLNAEVSYLRENPKFKGEGMIGMIINCKGEVVQCKMDNKTKSKELDNQIEIVFNSLGAWKNGTINGKAVDTSQLFSFKIKKGVITF